LKEQSLEDDSIDAAKAEALSASSDENAFVALSDQEIDDFDSEDDDISYESMQEIKAEVVSRPKIVQRSVKESARKADVADDREPSERESRVGKKQPVKASQKPQMKKQVGRSEAKQPARVKSSTLEQNKSRQAVRSKRYALSDDSSDDQGSTDQDSEYQEDNAPQKAKPAQKPQPQPQPQSNGQGQRYKTKQNALNQNKAKATTRSSSQPRRGEERVARPAPKKTAKSERSSRSQRVDDEMSDDEYYEQESRPSYKNSNRLSANNKKKSATKRVSSAKDNKVKAKKKSFAAQKEDRAPKRRMLKEQMYDDEDASDYRSERRARAHSGKRPMTR
jgi:hypothetical protein